MKHLLWLALLLPIFAQAQNTNGTLQRQIASPNNVRGVFGSISDTIPVITGTATNGYILVYNSTKKKWDIVSSSTIVPSLSVGTVSPGGYTNGLNYASGEFRLGKVGPTNPGVLTTGTDTIAGDKLLTGILTISKANDNNMYLNSTGSSPGQGNANFNISRGASSKVSSITFGTVSPLTNDWTIGQTAGSTGLTIAKSSTASNLTLSNSTLTISSLPTGSIYSNSGTLTNTAPTSGTIGYWSRTGTTLSPANSGDALTVTGALTAPSGTFTDGTQGLIVRDWTGGSGSGAIYPYGVTPDNTNYNFLGNTSGAGINGSTYADLAIGGSSMVRATSSVVNVYRQLRLSNVASGTASTDSILVHDDTLNEVRRIAPLSTTLAGYLPLTGGTLTGALTGTSATFSASLPLTLTSSSGQSIKSIAADAVGDNYFSFYRSNGSTLKGVIGYPTSSTDIFRIYNNENAEVVFGTNGAERGQFTSGGFFKASNDGTYMGSTGAFHELRSDQADWVTQITNSHISNPSGLYIKYTASSPNGTTNYLFRGDDNTGIRFGVTSNGGISNYSANNVNLSDSRAKKGITKAGSFWNIIKAIEFDKYQYKDQKDSRKLLGVMAQQVESVYPEWVNNAGSFGKAADGTNLKSVYEQQLQYGVNIVVQELQVKVEKLEAENILLKKKFTDLESRIKQLEK